MMPMFSKEQSMESIAHLNEAFNVPWPKQRGKDLGDFQVDGPGGIKELNQLQSVSVSILHTYTHTHLINELL